MEVVTENNYGHLSEQGLHDIAYELLEEYGFYKPIKKLLIFTCMHLGALLIY